MLIHKAEGKLFCLRLFVFMDLRVFYNNLLKKILFI